MGEKKGGGKSKVSYPEMNQNAWIFGLSRELGAGGGREGREEESRREEQAYCSQLRHCCLRNDCSGHIGRQLGCSFRSSM